jgi:hypothetical protein
MKHKKKRVNGKVQPDSDKVLREHGYDPDRIRLLSKEEAQEHTRGIMDIFSSVDTALAELACSNCMEVVYKPLMILGAITNQQYPDLNSLENQLGDMRHIAPIYDSEEHRERNLPGGYSNCGPYKIVRLWRMWENPEGRTNDTEAN